MAERKRCTVVYALPERQYAWTVDLPLHGTIADALACARLQAQALDIPWESADVGVFGELRDRSSLPQDGDRIELYRPLGIDPKESRRERVRKTRAAKRSGR